MAQDLLAQRYGRTPGSRRRAMVVGLAALGAMLVVVIAWVVWAGLLSPGASLQTRDLGYVTHEQDATVDIRFEVTTDPGTPVSCALQALNEQFAIVGWKIVELPVSGQRMRAFEETVRVTEPAVTGLIYRCWLT